MAKCNNYLQSRVCYKQLYNLFSHFSLIHSYLLYSSYSLTLLSFTRFILTNSFYSLYSLTPFTHLLILLTYSFYSFTHLFLLFLLTYSFYSHLLLLPSFTRFILTNSFHSLTHFTYFTHLFLLLVYSYSFYSLTPFTLIYTYSFYTLTPFTLIYSLYTHELSFTRFTHLLSLYLLLLLSLIPN